MIRVDDKETVATAIAMIPWIIVIQRNNASTHTFREYVVVVAVVVVVIVSGLVGGSPCGNVLIG